MSVDDCVIRGPTFPGLWLGVDELLRHGEGDGSSVTGAGLIRAQGLCRTIVGSETVKAARLANRDVSQRSFQWLKL